MSFLARYNVLNITRDNKTEKYVKELSIGLKNIKTELQNQSKVIAFPLIDRIYMFFFIIACYKNG